MDAFEYRGKTLFCEDVKTEDIIGDVGTPTYIYSKNAILARYSELKTALRTTGVTVLQRRSLLKNG